MHDENAAFVLKRLDIFLSGGKCILPKKSIDGTYKIHESPSRSCNYLLHPPTNDELVLKTYIQIDAHWIPWKKPTTPCMQQQPDNWQLQQLQLLVREPWSSAMWRRLFLRVGGTVSSTQKPCNMKTTEQRYAKSLNSGKKERRWKQL